MTQSLSLRIHDCLFARILDLFGEPIDIRLRIQQGDSEILKSIANEIDRYFDKITITGNTEFDIPAYESRSAVLQKSLFCQRIKDTVLEDIYSERLCPPLILLPDAMRSSESMHPAALHTPIEETPVHAVCLEYLPNICNELFPLMIDSYVCDLATHWRQHRCLIGVHADWLDNELRARRCIYYRSNPEELIETDLEHPLTIHSVHFLAVSPSFHQTWSARFADRDIFQINPYPIAAQADDKYACIQGWIADRVPTPEAVLLSRTDAANPEHCRSMIQDAFHSLFRNESSQEIVLIVQPNQGTEGRGVRAYTGEKDGRMFLRQHDSVLFEQIRSIARKDDILLRRGLRNVRFHSPHTGQDVCFDLRVNVTRGRMESGFLMAAPPGAVIASPGQGGHLVEWKPEAEWTLRIPDQSDLISWDEDIWQKIQQVAEAATARFADCLLAGVDIRLSWQEGSIVPNVLDINPRPAGLAHSRYFDTGEPGISQILWDALPES